MTDTNEHDWITLHRLQFPEPVSSFERVFEPVAEPDCWLFGPHYSVVTSAGFVARDAAALPRIKRFVAGVVDVLDAYGAHPSHLRRAAFRGSFDGRDGFTFSLWRSDEGMRHAAYLPGTHRTRIDEDKAGLLSDRSSFTRLRLVRSWGDWDGEVVWPDARER